ncbi:hypothetical protein OX284_005250 [Flavobacterium sp. SUN046]|uniref:hypothetical protein n=1 Tax=Flavobacterium sp. SUN046 TaxID=3002440 RepID=UPI002DBC749B|nr:hypothetical protein [Flavobacterium sp. SUN046]MEC4048825.1 hypothetical protein [Flavobacterium sp. SUN046]
MAIVQNKYIIDINRIGENISNPVLLRIHLYPNYTKIDFGYVTTNKYDKGGWIRINQTTFIENTQTNERYFLTDAKGIAIAPEYLNFESTKDWQFFSLFFPTLPRKSCSINIIESEQNSPDYFNYYNIDLDMKKAIELL